MEQKIEVGLWNEFEQELKKSKRIKVNFPSNLSLVNSKGLESFWERFLTEDFPEGSINSTLEKNFAVYIVQNGIDIEQVKEKYESQKWNVGGLLGWIRKVNEGEIKELNVGELVLWCKNFKPELVDLFKDIQKEKVIANFDLLEKKEFKILWNDELNNYQQESSNWYVKDFIREGNIIILGGKTSTLKSWLSLTFSCSVAFGKSFLGKFESEKGNVLYIDRENGFGEIEKRKNLILKGLDITEEERGIATLSESHIKLDNINHLKFLEEFIIDNNIKFIVVDTYRRVIGFDENDAGAVSNFFIDMIKPLCERTKVSFLFIHHQKKGESSGDDIDMLRGSSDFANYVDSIIQVERKGDNLRIKQNKMRGQRELEPFNLKVKTDEVSYFKFIYTGVTQTKEIEIARALVEWILKDKLREVTYKEILNYAEGMGYKKTNINNSIKDLRNKGMLSKGENKRDPYLISKDLSLGAWE